MFRRMIARFVILGGFVMGTLFLAQPAYADACFTQCNAEYQACRASGALGCDQVFADCVCSCRGTC